jgi:uncharacterized protein DUF1572
MPNEAYIPMAIREFDRLKGLADKAMAQMPPDGFFAVPGEGDNSVAVIVKHIAGNLLSRWRDFLTSDGEKPDRRRDEEFVISAGDSRAALLTRWEEGWAAVFGALSPLKPSDLERTVVIRREPLSVLQAINRQLTHNAYHVGQIVYLAKHYRGSDWKSLSIPLGQSERFNRAPANYVEKP